MPKLCLFGLIWRKIRGNTPDIWCPIRYTIAAKPFVVVTHITYIRVTRIDKPWKPTLVFLIVTVEIRCSCYFCWLVFKKIFFSFASLYLMNPLPTQTPAMEHCHGSQISSRNAESFGRRIFTRKSLPFNLNLLSVPIKVNLQQGVVNGSALFRSQSTWFRSAQLIDPLTDIDSFNRVCSWDTVLVRGLGRNFCWTKIR